MIPAAMSASCAFMLPVATAPNAVIYGSGKVSIKDMARAGFALNLFGVVVITIVSYLAFT
jgi:sodium-dependent dicarboxylate transporter 2/3/5